MRIDDAALAQLMKGPGGAVWDDLHIRGNRVLNRARQLVPVDQGTLRASLTLEHLTIDGHPAVRIGSALDYALYVHEGTGIYAGRGPIRARGGGLLRWPNRNNSGVGNRRYKGGRTQAYIYARQVRGMKGTPYLRDALPAAAG